MANAQDKRRAWMYSLKESAVSRPLDPFVRASEFPNPYRFSGKGSRRFPGGVE